MSGNEAPDGSGTTVLAAVGLTRRFRGTTRPAVWDVDVTVSTGEVVAVVGESGCGKTTLLRMIAGLETPDDGVIRIGDRVVAGPSEWVPPERREVGMVFQDFALFPHLRARENVEYGLHALPRRDRRSRAERMLARVGLADYGGRYPHELSGGQQQRVALARALAPEPRLLLLDEPFSNLDATLKAELRDELADILRRTAVPTLLVVHDAEDVFLLAERVTVLRAGRVLQSGTPDALYRAPRNEYVARFFGETNVLFGRSVAGGLETPVGFIPDAAGPREGQARVLIRPEDLALSTDPGRGTPAVVRRIHQHGRRRWVAVALEGDSGTVVALTPDGASLAPGERVYLAVRPDAACVLEEPDARTDVPGDA